MTRETSQRQTLRFGGVQADIVLVKTSGKPKEAQHETKRVLVEPEEAIVQEFDPLPSGKAVAEMTRNAPGVCTEVEPVRSLATPPPSALAREIPEGTEPPLGAETPEVDPLGGGDPAARVRGHVGHRVVVAHLEGAPDVLRCEDCDVVVSENDLPRVEVAPHQEGQFETLDDAAHFPGKGAASVETARHRESVAEYKAPETTVQQGVYLEDGTWLDLTDRLKEIDERTKLDAMEVVATIASSAVPRERVRGASYIGGGDPKTYKVLALLHDALRHADAAAVVRWTARTQQRLGIIVARAGKTPHLLLLECEWAENMREPSARVTGPIKAETTPREQQAAAALVASLHAPPSKMDELRDERLGKRAELLEMAREGKVEVYVAPPEPAPVVEAEDVAEALMAAAS